MSGIAADKIVEVMYNVSHDISAPDILDSAKNLLLLQLCYLHNALYIVRYLFIYVFSIVWLTFVDLYIIYVFLWFCPRDAYVPKNFVFQLLENWKEEKTNLLLHLQY